MPVQKNTINQWTISSSIFANEDFVKEFDDLLGPALSPSLP